MADPQRGSVGAAPRGIVPRVLQSWVAPRRVVRGLSDMPEGSKLGVLMSAMLIFLIAQAPGHARLAQLDPAVPFQARMGGALLAVMFMMPILAYGLAALASLLSRLTPWRLTPRIPGWRCSGPCWRLRPRCCWQAWWPGLWDRGPPLPWSRRFPGWVS
ncbi:hypothetical protein ACFSYD_12145 [Paracoccus aerius]